MGDAIDALASCFTDHLLTLQPKDALLQLSPPTPLFDRFFNFSRQACAPQLSGQISDTAARAQHHRCNSEVFAVLQSQVMLRRTSPTEPANAEKHCGGNSGRTR